MKALGKGFKYGDNVDTDVIIPARYLNSSDPAELATHCMEDIDKDFLYYVLADDAFFTYAMATSKGTKMPRGDKTSIMQYEVPCYDKETQQKIASILRSIDDKIALNNKINNNLEA